LSSGQDTPKPLVKKSVAPVRKKAPVQGGINAAAGGRDAGSALRTVYQKTVDEAVPREFLDLLGKLD
jgi:hypothetical protein